jgi:hypothetical protein
MRDARQRAVRRANGGQECLPSLRRAGEMPNICGYQHNLRLKNFRKRFVPPWLIRNPQKTRLNKVNQGKTRLNKAAIEQQRVTRKQRSRVHLRLPIRVYQRSSAVKKFPEQLCVFAPWLFNLIQL